MKSQKQIKDKIIRFRVTSKLLEQLQNHASEENRPLSNLIETALITYLKKHSKHS